MKAGPVRCPVRAEPGMSREADLVFMRRAFELARAQHGRTGRNPAVGCVIVSNKGRILSEAATGDGGGPHAEETALKALDGRADGATAYVTLEPCRQRSTNCPACSTLLVQAGIARIVCAIADAHPNGAGGFKRLEAAGMEVETGLMATEAAALYAAFFKASRRQ